MFAMIDMRYKACFSGEAGADSWYILLVCCIHKLRNAVKLGQWRAISLLSCLLKWYNAVLTLMAQVFVRFNGNVLGFRSGQQI